MSSCAFFFSSGTPSPPTGGMLSIGSDLHRTLFCRTLLEAFNPYDPRLLRHWVVPAVVRLTRRFMGEAMRLAGA